MASRVSVVENRQRVTLADLAGAVLRLARQHAIARVHQVFQVRQRAPVGDLAQRDDGLLAHGKHFFLGARG